MQDSTAKRASLSLLIVLCLAVSLTAVPTGNSSNPGHNYSKIYLATEIQQWNHTYGGKGNEYVFDLVRTSEGGYAVGGCSDSGHKGNVDAWLAKVDMYGNLEWNRTFGDGDVEYLFALVQTGDGGYALGVHDESFGAWLIKTDACGNVQWSRTFKGTPEISSLIQTSDGGYALAGSINLIYKSLAHDYFWLAKTDECGNLQWNCSYGDWKDYATSLLQTNDGGYVLVGAKGFSDTGLNDAWLVRTDTNGSMLWNCTYGGAGDDYVNSLVKTSDGGYAMAGSTNSYSEGSYDFWLIKTDENGMESWNNIYGGPFNDYGASVVESSEGGFALTGTKQDATHSFPWLGRMSEYGSLLWDRTYSYGIAAFSVVEASDGGYCLASYTGSLGAGGFDAYLIKTNNYGIVPEFPIVVELLFLLTATTVTIVFAKKKLDLLNLPSNSA